MTTPGAVPASMGKRLLAHLIDQVAYLLVGGAFVVAGAVSLLDGRGAQAVALPPLSVVGVVLLVGIVLVQWWYQGARGFTIGKRLVGLRTLSARTGRPVGMGRILLRGLVVLAGTLVAGVGQLVVYLSPYLDASGRRQGWHDKAAGTMVFDVVIGRDPAEADQVRGAAEALERLDALMGTPRHRSGSDESSSGRPAAAGVRTAVEAPAVAPRWRAPDPGPVLAPRLPAHPPAAADPVPAGVISSVPVGVTASVGGTDGAASSDGPTARHVAREPLEPDGPAEPEVPAEPEIRAEPPSTSGRPSASGRSGPSDATVATGLAEDVEMTRLRPARGKVPEVPCEGRLEATIELTDGRCFTVVGTALVGRRPTPRRGEDEAQLIRVADPGRSVSKTHLAIGVDRSGVWIRDRDSTNGTVVTLTDGQQILCAAEQQVRVPPGAMVAFGDYGLTVTGGPGSEA